VQCTHEVRRPISHLPSLNAGDLESCSGCDEHDQPFPILGANQRKGHSGVSLWTRHAFRSFSGLHRVVYWCQFRDASFNKYTQGRWCVGNSGKPTRLSSVLVCSRSIVQVPQRIKQTYSAPLTFPVNQHLLFCSCQYCTRYPAARLIIMTRTNSHIESLTASILNHARKSWLFPLAWRHKQAALFDGSMSKDTFFDKQVFRAARLRALGLLANSMREIAVAGPCSPPLPPGVQIFNCVVGPLDTSAQVPLQIALSIPVSHIHIHVLSTSALFASHPYDLQIMPKDESPRRVVWHYGPPTANVEIKLTGIDESAVEQGRDPEGLVRLQSLTFVVRIDD
jgi:hypothetical protein